MTLGQTVRVIAPAGQELEGVTADIDVEEALLIETEAGQRRVCRFARRRNNSVVQYPRERLVAQAFVRLYA